MKANIKTAVIGVGNMGKHHARVLAEVSHLLAVADIIEERGKGIAVKYGTNYYKDYRKMLITEKPEAVSVAVPTSLHQQIANECLRKKIPVLVEKPLAKTVSEGRAMLAEAEKNKTSLMVGHLERFNPAVVKLKNMIDQDQLGRIISLLAVRVGISPPKAPNSDAILDLAIHDVDIFNFLLGQFPQRVKIVKLSVFPFNRADSGSVLLEYNQATGMIQTNWISPVKIRRLYVSGTRGFAELGYIGQKLVMWKKLTLGVEYEDFASFLSLANAPRKRIYVSKKEPLKEELLFFLNNFRNPEAMKEILQSAYKALEILSNH